MTDRELLEAAAKAAGMDIEWQPCGWAHDNETGCEWNPLTDDGDAFELAVKLRLDIGFEKLYMVSVWCRPLDDWVIEHCDDGMGSDIAEKTRRAIVRAAAAIGKEMK
jgi:hypothetical protein